MIIMESQNESLEKNLEDHLIQPLQEFTPIASLRDIHLVCLNSSSEGESSAFQGSLFHFKQILLLGYVSCCLTKIYFNLTPLILVLTSRMILNNSALCSPCQSFSYLKTCHVSFQFSLVLVQNIQCF